MESEAKRRRASAACTYCRSKKIRCDAARPTCGQCRSLGKDCEYVEIGRQLKTARRPASTSRRLEKIERVLELLMQQAGRQFPSAGDDSANSGTPGSDDDSNGERSPPQRSPGIGRSPMLSPNSAGPVAMNPILGQSLAPGQPPNGMALHVQHPQYAPPAVGHLPVPSPHYGVANGVPPPPVHPPLPGMPHLTSSLGGHPPGPVPGQAYNPAATPHVHGHGHGPEVAGLAALSGAAARSEPLTPGGGQDSDSEDEGMISRINHIEARASSNEKERYYTHGMYNFVLSGRAMAFLEAKINNPALVGRLGESLRQCMIQNEETVSRLVVESERYQQVDLELINECIAYCDRLDSHFMSHIVTPDELRSIVRGQRLDSLRGPDCAQALIIFAVVAIAGTQMQMLPDTTRFRKAYLSKQVDRAMSNCLRAAQRFLLLKPSIVMVRGLLLFLLAGNVLCLPQIVSHFTSFTINVAKDIGLNRGAHYVGLDEHTRMRRLVLWWVAYTQDGIMAAQLGKPDATGMDFSAPPLPEFPLTSDLVSLPSTVQLIVVYRRIYERLFSSQSEARSTLEIMDDVIACDKELRKWRDGLPSVLILNEKNELLDPAPFQSKQNCMQVYPLYLLSCYHQMIMLVHRQTIGLPAKVRRHLVELRNTALNGAQNGTKDKHSPPGAPSAASPAELERVLHSLRVCADSAREVLDLSKKLAAEPFGLSGGSVLMTLNAVVALFLKGVVHPDEKSQGDSQLVREVREAHVHALDGPRSDWFGGDLGFVFADIIDACYWARAGPKTRAQTERPTPTSLGNTPNTAVSPAYATEGLLEKLPFDKRDSFDAVANELFPDMGIQFANETMFMTNNIYNNSDGFF